VGGWVRKSLPLSTVLVLSTVLIVSPGTCDNHLILPQQRAVRVESKRGEVVQPLMVGSRDGIKRACSKNKNGCAGSSTGRGSRQKTDQKHPENVGRHGRFFGVRLVRLKGPYLGPAAVEPFDGMMPGGRGEITASPPNENTTVDGGTCPHSAEGTPASEI